MYCPKCGVENLDNAQLCQSCSWVLTSISPAIPNQDAKTSGLAITALILAILSFFTFFLTLIPAVIFGIVALVKIEKSKGRLKGKGLAITGIALPAASLPIIALMMGILMPALAGVRSISLRMMCGSNMSGLGRAMLVYAGDFDEVYPDSSKWCDLLIEHEGVLEKQFSCQGASEGPCNYAMNKNIQQLGPSSPPDMVVLFETAPGRNQAGGPEILTTENHDGEGCNIVFNNFHVRFISAEDINDLKWTVTPEEISRVR